MTPIIGRSSGQPKIGLRVISSLGWQGGVNYVINLAKACSAMPANERPDVWLLPYDQRGAEIAKSISKYAIGIHPFADAASLRLDLVFPATQVFEAPFMAPWAGWIPDWQCKYLPELFDAVERDRRDLQYGTLATRSPFLVLSSQMAIDDSKRLFGDKLVDHHQLPFNAEFDRDTVARAAQGIAQVQQKFKLPERYFLVANQWWAHKNHEVVLTALGQLSDLPVHVACTGSPKDHRWPDYPASLFAKQPRSVMDRVSVLGAVERDEQISLMLGAVAIIQPSRFEGWSTVVEEARALSLPILLSDIPVHKEQAPPTGRFFSVNDPQALAVLMRDLWSSSPKSAPEQSIDEHRRYCVRQLTEIALATKARFDPDRHDPAVILADMTAACVVRYESSPENALYTKTLSAARSMLSTNSKSIARYRNALSSVPPDIRKTLERQVAKPAALKAMVS